MREPLGAAGPGHARPVTPVAPAAAPPVLACAQLPAGPSPMPRRPHRTVRPHAVALVALVAAVGLHGAAGAADPPPARTGWNAGTRPPAAEPPAAAPAGQMQVRVYEGFGTLGPVYGAKDTPLAVDVGLGLVTCPDGDTEIGAMNIGGARYDVAGTCRGTERGSVTVEGATGATRPVAQAGPAADAARGIIRCDPSTWRCASTPPAAIAPGSAAPGKTPAR